MSSFVDKDITSGARASCLYDNLFITLNLFVFYSSSGHQSKEEADAWLDPQETEVRWMSNRQEN